MCGLNHSHNSNCRKLEQLNSANISRTVSSASLASSVFERMPSSSSMSPLTKTSSFSDDLYHGPFSIAEEFDVETLKGLLEDTRGDEQFGQEQQRGREQHGQEHQQLRGELHHHEIDNEHQQQHTTQPTTQPTAQHHQQHYTTDQYQTTLHHHAHPQPVDKWIIIMVGLPAAGKSTLGTHIIDHFHQLNIKTKLYNAGSIRRKLLATAQHSPVQDSEFFDFNNSKTSSLRERYAHMALDDLLVDLTSSDTRIGIFDATNSTTSRRRSVIDHVDKYQRSLAASYANIRLHTVLLELSITNPTYWRFNIEGKCNSPDYIDKPHDVSIHDFIRRTENYSNAFESPTQTEVNSLGINYIGFRNMGEQIQLAFNERYNDAKWTEWLKDGIFRELVALLEGYWSEVGQSYKEKVDLFVEKVVKGEINY